MNMKAVEKNRKRALKKLSKLGVPDDGIIEAQVAVWEKVPGVLYVTDSGEVYFVGKLMTQRRATYYDDLADMMTMGGLLMNTIVLRTKGGYTTQFEKVERNGAEALVNAWRESA